MRLLISYLIVIFFSDQIRIYGQDLKEDIGRMNAFYGNIEHFKTDVRMEIFSESHGKIMTQKSCINKSLNNFYYKVDGTELLLNEHVLIMINNLKKEVLYRKLDAKEQKALQQKYMVANLDSILLKYDSVAYHGQHGDAKHYTIYSHKGIIKRTELYLEKETSRISRLTYFYNQKLSPNAYKAEIYFENMEVNPQFNKEFFSEDRIVQIRNKKLSLTGNYPGYVLNIIDSYK